MSSSAKSQPSPPSGTSQPASGVEIAVVGSGKSPSAYVMFEARDLTSDGAFLRGDVFLEVDEEFDVRFTFATEGTSTSVDATARVVSLDPSEPGMTVTFAMSADDKKKLQGSLSSK